MILTAPKRTKKISDSIIDQIRDAVITGQYKLGDKIGSEKDLLAQLNVSKATLREALRVLEAMGIIQIRKGLTGGVFVAEVDMKTTLASILSFLNFQAVSIKDITMVRYILEPTIIQLVAPLITEEDDRKIEELINSEAMDLDTKETIRGISFHRNLARLTRNAILIFMMDFIDNLIADVKAKQKFGADYYNTITTYHRRILDCIRKKDIAGAIRVTKEDILFVGRYMAQKSNSPNFEPADFKESFFDPIELPVGKSRGEEPQQSPLRRALAQVDGAVTSVDVSGRKMLLKEVGSGKLYMFELGEAPCDQ